MTEEINQHFPKTYKSIDEATKLSGFTMASDVLTCSLLRTLASSKPDASFLELGTGTGRTGARRYRVEDSPLGGFALPRLRLRRLALALAGGTATAADETMDPTGMFSGRSPAGSPV